MSKKFSCGIDFGTSNSTCAVFNGTNVSLVPVERGHRVLPSALFFSVEGQVYFGREAINNYIDGEEGRLLRGLKSVLGTSLMHERTVVGKKSRTFQDILSIYIENLKVRAESYLGDSLTSVVMGRPVHFHDNNPDADKISESILEDIAGKLGFTDISFQYEPIAAAYAHEQELNHEALAFVVDIGGGTSDFTVICLSPERTLKFDRKDDILSTSGVRIGGTNFDKSLSLSSFMPYLGLGSQYRSEFDKSTLMTIPSKVYSDLSYWPFIHQAQTRQAVNETMSLLKTAEEPEKIGRLLELQKEQLGHAFLQAVERAKIELSSAEEWLEDMRKIGLDFSIQSNRTDFLSSIANQIEKIEHSMNECLSNAGCQNSDIDIVILTGGSSELPVINQLVQDKFPNAAISKNDKFGSVGRGLAYNAANLFKNRAT